MMLCKNAGAKLQLFSDNDKHIQYFFVILHPIYIIFIQCKTLGT